MRFSRVGPEVDFSGVFLMGLVVFASNSKHAPDVAKMDESGSSWQRRPE